MVCLTKRKYRTKQISKKLEKLEKITKRKQKPLSVYEVVKRVQRNVVVKVMINPSETKTEIGVISWQFR